MPYYLLGPILLYLLGKELRTVYTSVSVTRKNRQMSIKVAQKWFHMENDRFWHLYKKLPKDVVDLGNLICAKGFKNLPKVQ